MPKKNDHMVRVSEWADKLIEAEIEKEVNAGRKAPSRAVALDRLLERRVQK